MKRKYLVFINSFLLLFIFQITSFSQNNSVQLKYLTKNSDAILTGKVIQQKSQWNGNKSRIFTIATIQVDEYLKGSANNRINVIYPGGEVDGVGELYSHTAKLESQEDVLLFVKKDNEKDHYLIFEGEQGKFSLHTDKLTGEKFTGDNKRLSSYKAEIRKIITQD